MNLTKEECEKALERIVYLLCLECQQIGGKIEGECYMKCIKDEEEILEQLINEHFDNQKITSISAYRILKHKIDELEKALDKACELLEASVFDVKHFEEEFDFISVRKTFFKSKDEWKEYLLNGD